MLADFALLDKTISVSIQTVYDSYTSSYSLSWERHFWNEHMRALKYISLLSHNISYKVYY